MPQTPDTVQATYRAADGGVVGTLSPQSYDRSIVLMAIEGPANSTLTIYRGYIPAITGRISRVYPADSRTYDTGTGDAPIKIRSGEAATFVWTGGAAIAGATASANIVSEWGQ